MLSSLSVLRFGGDQSENMEKRSFSSFSYLFPSLLGPLSDEYLTSVSV